MRERFFAALGAGALSALCAGCFGVRQLDVNAGLEGYQALHPDLAAAAAKSAGGASVAIDLIVPETAGCVPIKVVDEAEKTAKGAFRCDLAAIRKEEEKDDLKKIYEAKADEALGKGGIAMEGYGGVAKASLEKHLASYFDAVTVTPTTAAAGGTQVAGEGVFHFQFWRTDTKTMTVTLTATPAAGGAPIAVTAVAASEMGNGHLAWMIPVGVLTFPIGFAIGSIVFDNMEVDLMERVIAEAIDKSAKELAAKLAAAAPATGPTAYRIDASVTFL